MSRLDQAEGQIRRATILVVVTELILVVAVGVQTWLLISSGDLHGLIMLTLLLVVPATVLIPLGMGLDGQRRLITALREELENLHRGPGSQRE
jgi:ACR3 family arsenite efflux pump ArsB